jgi:sporulation integral membrane protein YlbJ
MRVRRTKQRMPVYLYAAFAVVITVAIIAFPSDSFSASKEGLRVWWEIVFPALLPFFVAAEVLMGLGVVHMLGVLLEPLMRPLFRVPGVGAFAVAMGLASGYPIGAKITATLRSQGMCSRVEAERLISISNTADPLFMAGAVAVGMFAQARLGIVLALSHYAASILLGLVMRFYGSDEQGARPTPKPRSPGMLKRALNELVSAREADGRPIGRLLGDAVKDSVSTLLLIGGFIMVFSVITRIMSLVGIVHALAAPLTLVLKPLKVEASLLDPLLEGLFEITIGCEEASRASASLYSKIVVCSAIIGWSGLSVHAQVASLIHKTDIRLHAYMCSRVLHAALAAAMSALLLRFEISPAAVTQSTAVSGKCLFSAGFLHSLAWSTRLFCIVAAAVAVIAVLVALASGLRIIRFSHSSRR